MDILVKIIQLVLSLSILVIIHEFGHFITAKIFKCRVEKFYLFFDPWFSLFKLKRGETEYGIGWLPLGGYVKIAGMVDESMDVEQLKKDPEPWEFRSKKAWQRLIVMLAGVTMNILLAMIIYISMSFCYGREYIPTQNVNNAYGISVDSTAYSIGLRNGDKILKVCGKEETEFKKITMDLLLEDPKTILVERQGQQIEINLKDENIASILKNETTPFIGIRMPFSIADVMENSAAQKAGLQKGDKFVMIDSLEMQFVDQVKDFLTSHKGQSAIFSVKDSIGNSREIKIDIPEDAMLGVYLSPVSDFIQTETIHYGFFESIPAGIKLCGERINEYLKQWKLIFNPDTQAYKSLGSFISMTKIFPDTWDWSVFWNITALFSIMLAVLNIIPIPGLDGGHAVFCIYEIIVGKAPSTKFMTIAQYIGMGILLALMIFAIGNDFIRHVFN